MGVLVARALVTSSITICGAGLIKCSASKPALTLKRKKISMEEVTGCLYGFVILFVVFDGCAHRYFSPGLRERLPLRYR